MAEQKSRDSKAATKVQEVAANVRQARSPRKRISKSSAAESVARRYFDAIDARDLEAAVALWADGGRENVRGQVDVLAPEGVRAFLGELIDAVPDLRFEIVSTTTQDERCAVQYRIGGTFAGPGTLNGVAADRRSLRRRGHRPADRQGRPDPGQRRLSRLHRHSPPARHDPAAGLARRAAPDRRLQRQDAPDLAPVRRRRAAGRHRRVGRAGPARTLQRLLDRGRAGRDHVRRRRTHDETRAGARWRATRRHPAHRAGPRRTPIIAAPRPAWTRPSSATPQRCRTPKAAAAFATGPRACMGCPSPTAKRTA